MVFSSPIFLFGFLPITLLLYYAAPQRARNLLLLMVSLTFYAWGEVFYLGVMLASIAANYIAGLLIAGATTRASLAYLPKLYLSLGVAVNLALLISCKYANFIADNLNAVLAALALSPVNLEPVHLPLGISFFTFQAISYIVDVYRKDTTAQKNIFYLALYISLFPQLIAGPIVRYHDIVRQIVTRKHSLKLFASGAQRFIFGLSKKMLIANPLGEVTDSVFALSGNDLTMPLAWIGIVCFTLQIYFDFSGYSDMAIGLGRMLGFNFKENFNYPYIARSLREFWRRWHISLSTWFRDYVYIPLGGSRATPTRVLANLFLVFVLTGIWHGASWNFVAWGLFHGVFLASEHMGISRVLSNLWRPLQHLYTLLIVVFSWVFFKAETLTQAIHYIDAMISPSQWHTTQFQYEQVLVASAYYALPVGLVLSLPLYRMMMKQIVKLLRNNRDREFVLVSLPSCSVSLALLMLCAVFMAASTYNPFIYFRF